MFKMILVQVNDVKRGQSHDHSLDLIHIRVHHGEIEIVDIYFYDCHEFVHLVP